MFHQISKEYYQLVVWPQTIKNIIIGVVLSALSVLMLLLEAADVALKSRFTVACLYLRDGTAWEHAAAPLPLSTALRAGGVRSVHLELLKASPHTPARNLLAEVHRSKCYSWTFSHRKAYPAHR